MLERSEYTAIVEKNNRRVRQHPEIYSARQQIIEHVFGTIKPQWGYDHILLKGLHKNDGEFGLIYLIYNLRRIINILGVEKMKIWIQKVHFPIFNNRMFHDAWEWFKIECIFSRFMIVHTSE